MALEIGSIVEGKITGITKFGAFVSLPEGKSGLVHISEIANSYVNDVAEYVQLGQTVKVRVLNISEDGRINLSIKRTQDAPPRQERHGPAPASRPVVSRQSEPPIGQADGPSADKDFEDRLKKFMQESDSRIADNRRYAEHRQRRRR